MDEQTKIVLGNIGVGKTEAMLEHAKENDIPIIVVPPVDFTGLMAGVIPHLAQFQHHVWPETGDDEDDDEELGDLLVPYDGSPLTIPVPGEEAKYIFGQKAHDKIPGAVEWVSIEANEMMEYPRVVSVGPDKSRQSQIMHDAGDGHRGRVVDQAKLLSLIGGWSDNLVANYRVGQCETHRNSAPGRYNYYRSSVVVLPYVILHSRVSHDDQHQMAKLVELVQKHGEILDEHHFGVQTVQTTELSADGLYARNVPINQLWLKYGLVYEKKPVDLGQYDSRRFIEFRPERAAKLLKRIMDKQKARPNRPTFSTQLLSQCVGELAQFLPSHKQINFTSRREGWGSLSRADVANQFMALLVLAETVYGIGSYRKMPPFQKAVEKWRDLNVNDGFPVKFKKFMTAEAKLPKQRAWTMGSGKWRVKSKVKSYFNPPRVKKVKPDAQEANQV